MSRSQPKKQVRRKKKRAKRAKGWKDPRDYRDSMDPLEFVLSLLGDGKTALDPGLFDRLHKIADAHPTALKLHPLALDPQVTALKCISEVALFLLAQLPEYRQQVKRIRLCSTCTCLFIHSEKKKTATNRYYCSATCRNRRPRTPEEKAAHAKRERDRRATLSQLNELGK